MPSPTPAPTHTTTSSPQPATTAGRPAALRGTAHPASRPPRSTRSAGVLRQCGPALRVLLALTVLCGLAYPALVLGVGRLVPARADGSMVTSGGRVVGSALLGQASPGARWFQPRPSTAGADGYDPTASGASNLGPSSPALLRTVQQRRAAVAAADGVDPAVVPPDAVTASASGLDPDISPAYAAIQVARVARANHLSTAQVQALVAQHTAGRTWGFIGEPTVDVLQLNAAVAAAAHR